METGDRLVYDFGGGGGWGDPLDRDPEACSTTSGTSTSRSAPRDEYGVVITGSLEAMTLALDPDATTACVRRSNAGRARNRTDTDANRRR